MSIKEIRMASVDVTSLHCNKILDKLVGRIHGFLEESDDDLIELLLQTRISSEQRLVQKLTQDAHEFVVD